MSERDKVMRAAERFLRLVPAQTREHGRTDHRTGQVVQFTCIKPDQSYTAVVRGGQDYDVSIFYVDQNWVADCTCPMHYDCKHAVAAILELQQQWTQASPATPIMIPTARNKPAKKSSSRVPSPSVPQPPPSPIYSKLVEQHGRRLDFTEASFIRKV